MYRKRWRRFWPCVFWCAIRRAPTTCHNKSANEFISRESFSLTLSLSLCVLCLSTSTFLCISFLPSIYPLLLMAQPLCSAIHSAPVNSGAKRHPAVVVNAVKRYKAASRVSKGKQQQIPCSPSAHTVFYLLLSLSLSLFKRALISKWQLFQFQSQLSGNSNGKRNRDSKYFHHHYFIG